MSRIDLNRVVNAECEKNCNKEVRLKRTENDTCLLIKSINDSLSVRCVGEWAEDKIYLLHQYFGIFSVGMKNKWPLNYIEICSGPGICINRHNGCEFDGTAISIMKHDQFQYINKALFFDYDQATIDVLNKRISNMKLSHKAVAKYGDYNNPNSIYEELKKLNPNSLNLILIDPTDCSVPFSLIKGLANILSRVDLIINVATMTDFNRNIQMAFADDKRAEKYIRFLGDSCYFSSSENREFCNNKNYIKLREAFRNTYKCSLKRIGFKFFDFTSINNYYDILYATSNKKGIEFWKKANKTIDSSGQRSLDFEI